ncbi:hypothetical protein XENTR_v10007760 [Xenopus tropicalis]|nr:hypothetical protein XENTR_v10007760 [Xenopus tropicalis]
MIKYTLLRVKLMDQESPDSNRNTNLYLSDYRKEPYSPSCPHSFPAASPAPILSLVTMECEGGESLELLPSSFKYPQPGAPYSSTRGVSTQCGNSLRPLGSSVCTQCPHHVSFLTLLCQTGGHSCLPLARIIHWF